VFEQQSRTGGTTGRHVESTRTTIVQSTARHREVVALRKSRNRIGRPAQSGVRAVPTQVNDRDWRSVDWTTVVGVATGCVAGVS
jgi:hypothetical protein